MGDRPRLLHLRGTGCPKPDFQIRGQKLRIEDGSYGFCEEYTVERLARDNVVDTIFEGTNDINRLVIAGGLALTPGRIMFRPVAGD